MNNLIERVIEVVCEYFGVEEDKLLLKRSYASVCDARKFIIYILHCDFGVPASTLAKRFSMHQCNIYTIARKAKTILQLYGSYQRTYSEIMDIIG